MSPMEAVIEARAEQALKEIEVMARRAQEEVERGLAFIARSNGQRFRWAKYHHKGESK